MTDDYRALLARHGRTHWWIVGMRKATWAMLGEVEGPVLDVGCGPGWDLTELPSETWSTGIDLHAGANDHGRISRADAGHLPFPDGCFRLVLALDILEQKAVMPCSALREIRRVLAPGGRLLVRVPAHSRLFGPHDLYWGGMRRYVPTELREALVDSGFRVRRLSYANTLLFPAAAVSRLIARATGTGGNDLVQVSGALNRMLVRLLEMEAFWLARHNLPFGLSILCLAEG